MQIGRATVFSVVWSTKVVLTINYTKQKKKARRGLCFVLINRLVIQALTILLNCFLVNPLMSLLAPLSHSHLWCKQISKQIFLLFVLRHSGS